MRLIFGVVTSVVLATPCVAQTCATADDDKFILDFEEPTQVFARRDLHGSSSYSVEETTADGLRAIYLGGAYPASFAHMPDGDLRTATQIARYFYVVPLDKMRPPEVGAELEVQSVITKQGDVTETTQGFVTFFATQHPGWQLGECHYAARRVHAQYFDTQGFSRWKQSAIYLEDLDIAYLETWTGHDGTPIYRLADLTGLRPNH